MAKHPHKRTTPTSNSRTVVGVHAVREALSVRPHAVTVVWVSSRTHQPELQALATRHKIRVEIKPANFLDRLASSNQGIGAAVAETPNFDLAQIDSASTVLLLDGIEDPQNLGSILRCAWLMSASCVYVPRERSAHLTPAVAKVASGGAEHVPVEVVPNLTQLIDELKAKEFWVYGLTEFAAHSLYELKLPSRVAWVVGSEEKGLRSTVEKKCDERVRIPQVQSGSSYNAAIALAIAMSEGVRQRTSRN